jgi:hypothetical protein
LRGLFEDLFHENGVDLYFGAHTHNYERCTAIYQNKTTPSTYEKNLYHNPEAPIYITVGNAGNYEDYEEISSTPADWSVVRSNAFGFATFTVHNSTHAYYEYIDALDDEIIDTLWITKNWTRYN